MNRDDNVFTFSQSLTVLLLAALLPVAGHGQATSNTNQIVGTVAFSNTNPIILDVLNTSGGDEGLRSLVITADSLNVTPPLDNSTTVTAATRTSTPYEITVEAGSPGNGILYRVVVVGRLDADAGDRYGFAPLDSAPVEEEPAPDTVVSFSECAALLDITWVDKEGEPVAVDGGNINARRETFPGSGSFVSQASDLSIPIGSSQEYLAVRGDGSTYDVRIFFDVGTDPFSDKIRLLHQTTVQASCDEVVPIECQVPDGLDGGLGKIVGRVDLLGKDENRVGTRTFVQATSGPFGNFRRDTVDVPTPSQGDFELENLVPSDETSPSTGYRVFLDMNIDLGHRNQYFRSPFLDSSNGRVFVSAGQEVDLADTFVMAPGFVRGEIFLTGPPPGELGSCLEDIFRDTDVDSNGDGVPNNLTLSTGSRVEASGLNQLATGATKTAFSGQARASFEGDFDPDPLVKAFVGDYDLALGGLLSESSIWRARHLVLGFRDTATPQVPETYQSATVRITDLDVPDLEIVPGTVTDVPIRRCFGQLELTYVSTATDFFKPRFSSSGTFDDLDWESKSANYSVSVSANGTPISAVPPVRQGLVVACLPEGTYNIKPVVTSINPGGGTSNTELPPVLDVEIKCMQTIKITPGLEVDLDAVPSCSAEPTTTLTGSAESTGSEPVFVEEVFATVNGGAPIPFCTDCGEDPPFQIDVPLQECDNLVTVTAEDELGNVSSATASTRFDNAGPVLEGCEDVEVDNDPGSSGAVVDFEVTAADNCDGVRPVSCDPPPGSFFPQGLSQVTCTAADACGNMSSCTFTVSVCQPVEPDVRTQGFWKRQCKGPHPSGEHDNLPSYVESVASSATFAGVADVAGLCDRLVPDPKQDKCEQAEAQLMAASLNVASGRVAVCNCLDDPDLGVATVGEALSLADGLLASPGRSFDDCVLAQAIADRINNGATLVDCVE